MNSKVYWLGQPLDRLPQCMNKYSTSLSLFSECGTDISVVSEQDVKQVYFYFSKDLGDLLEISIKICRNLRKNIVLVHEGDFLEESFSTDTIDKVFNLTLASDRFLLVNYATQTGTEKSSSLRDSSDIRIKKIEAFVSNNIGREIREEDVAKLSNLSTTYFSRFFRKHKDISFQDYLTQQRIELAQTILGQYPSEKISSVAYQAGYGDVAYFNRVFKKKTSLTPTQYRNSLLQSA
ncbi:helix-turn-helix domain-containing protein [Vibrio inusitatus]|nr:AraC family transcriptional regulator [Vibrio inusitatus]